MITAQEALDRLREGNERFVTDTRESTDVASEARRSELVRGQEPFAVILGCSDSRVPAEIIFNQGLGDLFVIRVAGNVVAPSQIGSVEFAIEMFGTPLVVVLGHSMCGAVEATIAQLERPSETRSQNLYSIVDRIRPAVQSLFETGIGSDRGELMKQCVRANIRASVNQLRHGSGMLESMIGQGRLTVVGAEYSLETGIVDFLEN
jgi:carbonic anhydrase